MTGFERGAGSMPDAARTSGMVTVGRITRLHGVRGEVRVRVESDHPDRFAPRSVFHTAVEGARLLVVREARDGPNGLIVGFAGFASTEAAARLVGAELLIRERDRRRLQPEEFWPDQLVGLEVRIGCEPVGAVSDVIQGAQDRLVVALRTGNRVEIPFVEALVPEVDQAGGWLRIDPPDGLLPR